MCIRDRRGLFDGGMAFRRISFRGVAHNLPSATNPKSSSAAPTAWAVLTFVWLALAGYAALFIAPTELTMGVIQRIFYFHVPSFWTAFIAIATTTVGSIAYLKTRAMKWDWIAVAASELATAFLTIGLVTGPIWAKPVSVSYTHLDVYKRQGLRRPESGYAEAHHPRIFKSAGEMHLARRSRSGPRYDSRAFAIGSADHRSAPGNATAAPEPHAGARGRRLEALWPPHLSAARPIVLRTTIFS